MRLSLKPLAFLSLLCFAAILLLFTPLQDRPPFPSPIIAPHTHLLRPRSLHQHQIREPHTSLPLACRGRSVYIHKLPPLFNDDLLRQCRHVIAHWLNFCAHLTHRGLGQPLHPQELLALSIPLNSSTPSSSSSSISSTKYPDSLAPAPGENAEWHRTDPYMLEVIFHHRLLQYPCLTEDPDMADAFFLPYYTGLDALHYLYGKYKGSPKAQHGSELVSWLKHDAIAKEAWRKHHGQDHFLILSRTPWDVDNLGKSNWGTGLLGIPEYANMTLLLVEKQPWKPNQQAIPYPTSFHPSSPLSLHMWVERVRTAQRSTLFTFAGSIRPALMQGGIRDMLMDQCSSSRDCKLLDCKELKCSHNPEPIMRAFLSSQFCLQPRGDTTTRRSLFDSIIAGCIPVLFHNDTAYTQYEWHLPKEASEWSVYIDEAEIRKGELVEGVLREYTQEIIVQMRERLLQMIPKVVYAKNSMLKQGEADAFDVSMRETIKLIARKKSKMASFLM